MGEGMTRLRKRDNNKISLFCANYLLGAETSTGRFLGNRRRRPRRRTALFALHPTFSFTRVLRARGRGLLPHPSPLINNKEAKSDEAD
jgi:hypothetical protein